MLKWALILMIKGQYNMLKLYPTQTECETAAWQVVDEAHKRKQKVSAGCYMHTSTTSNPSD